LLVLPTLLLARIGAALDELAFGGRGTSLSESKVI
jgi:hypothetical protein